MLWSPECSYEEVSRRQRELQERAARAQLMDRLRHEAGQARPARPGRSRWAARLRGALARP